MEKEQVTTWASLGSMASRVLDHPAFGKYDVSSVSRLGSGGAPTSEAAQQRMTKAFGGTGAKTENLTKLAQRSANFTNSYTVSNTQTVIPFTWWNNIPIINMDLVLPNVWLIRKRPRCNWLRKVPRW